MIQRPRAIDKPYRRPGSVDWRSVELLPISSLLPGDSPRACGEDRRHSEALAQVEEPLPPIVVHRSTMRVVDGNHRLQAARMRGSEVIEAYFFDGDEDAAFVLAVEANVSHGMPLALADRTAAAARILAAYPQWSDRAIASASGLSASTVAGIRSRSTARSEHSNARVGRDGRVRPLNGADGRRLAGELISERPDAPLREIANRAGISLATAHDVRMRLAKGESPITPKQRRREPPDRRPNSDQPDRRRSGSVPPARSAGRVDPAAVVHNLRQDPSLRYNEVGRDFLVWLSTNAVGISRGRDFLSRVPPHTIDTLAKLARSCSEAWDSFADALEQRARAEAVAGPGRIVASDQARTGSTRTQRREQEGPRRSRRPGTGGSMEATTGRGGRT